MSLTNLINNEKQFYEMLLQTISRSLTCMIFSLSMLSIGVLAQSGSWTEKQPLGNIGPNPKFIISFAVQNKGYILTAGDNAFVNQLWQFDPVAGKMDPQGRFSRKHK